MPDVHEHTQAARKAIEAMFALQEAWLDSGRGDQPAERWRTHMLGLVLAKADALPPGMTAYSDMTPISFRVEIREDDEDARVHYGAVPEELADLVDCAWHEQGERAQATAASLALELWSPAWEAERIRDALAPVL